MVEGPGTVRGPAPVWRVPGSAPIPSEGTPRLDAGVATAGMVLFALFAHTPFPAFALSVGGLGLTALALARTFRSSESLTSVFGISGFSRPVVVWCALAMLLAAGFSIAFRQSVGRSLLPATLEPFLLPAAAIGAAEELLYRGYVQGRLARLGGAGAILLAAGAHTAYKVTLFALPPEGSVNHYVSLGAWTFTVGAGIGLTRHLTRSVIPAVTAHVLFDVLVYGDWPHAPWWVWG